MKLTTCRTATPITALTDLTAETTASLTMDPVAPDVTAKIKHRAGR